MGVHAAGVSAVGYRLARMVAAGVVLGFAMQAPAVAQETTQDSQGRTIPAEGPYTGSPGSFADLAAELVGAVVNISTSQTVSGSDRSPTPQVPRGSPFEEFFEEFFNRQEPGDRPRRVSSLGSGFVIDPDGVIVTNNHVIADADEIVINLSDGRELPAEVVGRDRQTDIAVLRVEPDTPLTSAEFGDSDALRVGDWVLAIGNPFGLGGTVTAGIVSAQERNINAGPYDSFIQTDASINRGNSGGPLFDMNGQVVGINTAIISPTGSSVGIGFAIPANLARSVIDQLVQHGETRRGWLGVRIQTVTDEIAESLGMDSVHGALVAGVSSGGPAGDAGIETGDVILEFDGRPVSSMRELPRIVADTPVGKEVDILVLRRGDEQSLRVTVGRLEESEDQMAALTGEGEAEDEQPVPGISALGLTLADLTDEVRADYEIAETVEGVVVTGVDSDGPGAERQIREGDVIVEVSQEKVATTGELEDALRRVRERNRNSTLLLVASRSGDLRFVVMPLDEDDEE